MIAKRFNVLYDLIRAKGLDLDSSFRSEQKKWTDQLVELHHNLTNWELEHCNMQTFSKAFEPLIDNIFVRKHQTYGANKPTVAGIARELQILPKKNPTSRDGPLSSVHLSTGKFG